MKIVDIADQIFRDLDTPSDLSIPAVAFWLRHNVGALNNHISTDFVIKAETGELLNSKDKEIDAEATAILKKMYIVHHYSVKLRSALGATTTDTVISVSDDNSSVTKINKNEVSKTYAQVRRQEYSEMQEMIHAYKIGKAVPRQNIQTSGHTRDAQTGQIKEL